MSHDQSIECRRRASPFSLRLSDEERSQLERDASGQSLSSYIKDKLFSGSELRPKRRHASSYADRQAIAQLLATLGQSRISQNLNQIAKLAHLGALPVDEELTSDLNEACSQIASIRQTLMSALNMKERHS